MAAESFAIAQSYLMLLDFEEVLVGEAVDGSDLGAKEVQLRTKKRVLRSCGC